ncbi:MULTISPECIES: NAD(P)-dependent oxidoreductase [unclassified Streptomyces]|uniref:NAD-dependent epimerase/dehydratase family protein n=1 Tax=unclassified Streptomyces TaxID=2593676 RepID=UPI002DD7DF4A|nr:NAD(P)-dependent oxidoreductase [Streptomyces sp. NBC_01750]WSB03507.1 NAD(P)-dependent oxidoreductase [Streptomyces sp. NBC_01794]WSD32216.1 NAD(P)-dependent oxidoreductase [Streptomyces sp. NBC_01750]
MPAPRTVLLTGAAGGLGTLMRGLLPAYGYELRLFDATPIEGVPEAVTADLADKEALREAVQGVDAIIHLAGISLEAPFEKILRANIEGTYNLYEAAREEGIGRIVFASSNHAVGFTPRPLGQPPFAPDQLIPIDTPRRPDTFYGLSKCFGEDLAQLYWDLHGLETVSVRIGSCFMEPTSVRMLSVWMSPGDGARLFHAALTAEHVGHAVVYGSSANSRLWWDLTTARALGYEPQDDSEQYAEKLVAQQGELDPDNPDHAHLGGHFTTNPPQWPY